MEVAVTEETTPLETGDLGNFQSGFGDPHVDECLYFKSVAPEHRALIDTHDFSSVEIDDREALAAEGVVAVAEIRVVRSVKKVHHFVQKEVSDLAESADVAASSPRHEARALREVSPLLEDVDEEGDLGGIR